MKENKKDIITKLIAHDERKQSREKRTKVRRLEEIRQQIEETGRIVYVSYQRRCQQLETEARVAFEVITHWFNEDTVQSGVYQQLAKWRNGEEIHVIDLIDNLEYSLPTRVIREFEHQDRQKTKPFDSYLDQVVGPFAAGYSETEAIKDLLRELTEETWRAEINFTHPNHGLGLSIWQSETEKTRQQLFGYRPKHTGIDFGIYPTTVDKLLTEVHPIVLTEFAKQIENGQVWKRIESRIRAYLEYSGWD